MSLFGFSDGKWELVAERLQSSTSGQWTYPTDSKGMPLVGDPGTELLLVCGRKSGRIDVMTLEAWLGAAPLPKLSEEISFTLNEAGVHQKISNTLSHLQGKARPFDKPVKGPDPTDPIRNRLREMREKLAEKCDMFAGICFAHRERLN